MTTPAASDAPLRIEGEMTIYRAEELKQALLEPLQPHTTLEVNLSAVTELDTAGVQLLMLAKRTAQKQEGQLRLVGHSAHGWAELPGRASPLSEHGEATPCEDADDYS